VSILGAARICDANALELKHLADYARAFGLVYQITDDIADGNRDDEPSFVRAVGLEKSKVTCVELVERAKIALEPFGPRAEGLKNLISYLNERVGDVPRENKQSR